MTNDPADLNNVIFKEIDTHLTQDNKPSVFINSVSNHPKFRSYPFDILYRLKTTEQSPRHHPEGNAWNHTMMVVDEAAKRKNLSKEPEAFMWAALLHDIGKPGTTKYKKSKITSYNHDKKGAELTLQFLSEFGLDSEFIRRVSALVRWHMQFLHVVEALPFADINTMKKETDVHEIAILGLCDRLGRKGADFKAEQENARLFIKKCEMDKTESKGKYRIQ